MPCYKGYVDTLNEFEIFGWAIKADSAEEKACVDLVIDGTVVKTCRAYIFRKDLKELGISDGYSGFHFSPYNFLPESECSICIVYSGTDVPVPNGEKQLKKADYNFEISKTDYSLQIKTNIEKNAEKIDLRYSKDQYASLVEIDLPDELYVGNGLIYYCSGWIFNPVYAVKKIEVAIGPENCLIKNINKLRRDVHNYFSGQNQLYRDKKNVLYSGFFGYIDLPMCLAGRTENVKFIATFENKKKHIIGEKSVSFLAANDYYHPAGIIGSVNPLAAICMTTYQPQIESFKRQIDSLRGQTCNSWICIISDDGSDKGTLDKIEGIIKDDGRFHLFKNKKNIGFYKNFEKVLRYVPEAVQFVALCDQDDYWYPDKLEKLINKIKSDKGYSLVYSDMKIVGENGKVLSDTYWVNRKNHHKDLSMMLITNTVTGAASIFRRDLIDFALPFPQKLGNSFHDHVLACCALLIGKIGYIDEPLYEYIQYESSGIIGHCDFRVKKVSLFRFMIMNLFNRNYFQQAFKYFIEIYDADYMRLYLLSRVLQLRIKKTNKKLHIFSDRIDSVIKLFLLHIKIKILRQTTNDAELKLAFSYIVKKYLSNYYIPEG